MRELAVWPRRGQYGWMGVCLAIADGMVIILFLLPHHLSEPQVLTILCGQALLAAVCFRARDEDIAEEGNHPPIAKLPTGAMRMLLLALILFCSLDGMLDNLYVLDNVFYESSNRRLLGG